MANDDPTVYLGWLGRNLSGDDLLDVSKSRLGGEPVWPKALAEGVEAMAPCGLCHGPSVLVGQISAGYGLVPHRLLHVFACASNCGGCVDRRTWRVLRSTGPTSSAVEPEAINAEAGGSDGGNAMIIDEDWGLSTGGDDWGASAVEENWQSAAGDDWGASVDKNDWDVSGVGNRDGVDAELDALMAVRAANKGKMVSSQGAPSRKADRETAARDKETDSSLQSLGVRGTPASTAKQASPWPCRAFEICCEPAAGPKSGEHERELLERYLASELAHDEDASADGSGIGGKPLVPSEFACEIQREEAQMKTDADEGIDSDEDGVEDDDETMDYLGKFQRRIERCPEQVVRYAWGGEPLWLAPPPAQLLPGSVASTAAPRRGGYQQAAAAPSTVAAWPPPCERCGAARGFELQILPTLLSQLGATVKADWGVIVVYTCSADCATYTNEDGETTSEEFVVVQPAV